MIKKILLWVLVILWMGVIFYFSNQDAEKSTNQSQSIINKTHIVEYYEKENNVTHEEALFRVDDIFRKVAHFTVYFILSILLIITLREYNISINKLTIITIIICLAYSISDEIHQTFITGRSAELTDILLDNLGCITGLLIYRIIKIIKKR